MLEKVHLSRYSDCQVSADEFSGSGPATDSHSRQTRTRTALQGGRPRRRFEQYADYSSSDEQSVEVPPDVPTSTERENADEFFMEGLIT